MSTKMKMAFGCHLAFGIALAVFGLVYLFRSEFMPYHAQAVGMKWDTVTPPFRVLILALMRTTGGAWLATAFAIYSLLCVPFRQGERWARWAIPAVGLVVALSSLYVTLIVKLNTPASPPWPAAALGALMLVIGLLLSLAPDHRVHTRADR